MPGEKTSGAGSAFPVAAASFSFSPGPTAVRAGRELVRLAGAVAHGERRARGDDDLLRAGREQHADALYRRLAERRARVVVGDDIWSAAQPCSA